MAQPSILQSLGGPLGGQKFEFRGGNAMVGSAPDCAVRLEAPGVEGYHARIVIDITGATLHRVDGVVGVNDDVVMGDALLRSGDFVWIGEPGGATSLMFQFTLGDVEEEAPAEAPAAVAALPAEEVLAEDLQAPTAAEAEDALVAEEAPPPAPVEGPADSETMEVAEEPEALAPQAPEVASEAEIMEMAEAPSSPEPAMPVEPVMPAESMEEALVEETQPPAEPAPEPAHLEAAPEEAVSHEFEAVPEIESSFEAPAPLPSFAPVEAPVVVPLAPWQTASTPTPAAEPAPAEYASAWESSPPPPAPDTDATVTLQAAGKPAPAPAPPPPARATQPPAATPAPAPKRPTPPAAPKMKIRTVEQDAALRTPPPPRPPARTTSSTPMIVGGLALFVVVGLVGFLLLKPAPAPAPPPPTPRPTPVAVSTPEATPEPTQVAAAEPTLEPTPEPTPPPVAAPVAPTPRVAPTPVPRATPSPRATPAPRATPTPRGTPTPARAAAPVTAPTVAAVAAAVSQAPRLLEEARTAAAAKDLPRASQLYGDVLRIEPGNGEATARKAEVDARMLLLARKFSVGATTVLGGKAAGKGPTGFDLGGGAVVKTEFSAQVRCTTTPTAVEPGTSFSVRCSILNIGTKPFKLESIAANETADGAKTQGAGVTPRQDIAPQSDAVILERVGTWSAKSSWNLEIVAKTTKDESFRAVYNWR